MSEAVDGSEWVVELDLSWEGRGWTVDFKVGTGGLGGAPTAPHAELLLVCRLHFSFVAPLRLAFGLPLPSCVVCFVEILD